MAHVNSNPNPYNKLVDDCVVRALAIALNSTWQGIYIKLTLQGLVSGDMPSSNRVWSKFLETEGYKRQIIPDTCPYCYTVKDFCRDHPEGRYILGTGTHVVAVINGDYYDTWDSGDETPLCFWDVTEAKEKSFEG